MWCKQLFGWFPPQWPFRFSSTSLWPSDTSSVFPELPSLYWDHGMCLSGFYPIAFIFECSCFYETVTGKVHENYCVNPQYQHLHKTPHSTAGKKHRLPLLTHPGQFTFLASHRCLWLLPQPGSLSCCGFSSHLEALRPNGRAAQEGCETPTRLNRLG